MSRTRRSVKTRKKVQKQIFRKKYIGYVNADIVIYIFSVTLKLNTPNEV